MPLNLGAGVKKHTNAGTLMIASHTSRIMPIFWSKKVIPPVRSIPIWQRSAEFGASIWVQCKSPNGMSLKTPAAAAKKLWTSERTHNGRHHHDCTISR